MFPLRAKILTIVLTFITIIGTAFFLYSLFTTENYKRMRLEGIEKTVEFETEKVNLTIAQMERAAIDFATAGRLLYEAQSAVFAETLALELFRSFPKAIGGGFWYEPYAYDANTYRQGVYVFYDKERLDVRLDDSFFTDKYDYHYQSWYTEIAGYITEPYRVVWTRPYFDDTGSHTLMTTAGAGVFDEYGNLLAMSTIDWEINEVVATLTAIQPTENSFVVLCDPEKGYGITNTITRTAGLSLSELPWNIEDDLIIIEGMEFIVFRRMMDNGWLLLVNVPSSEIFEEVENQNNRFTLIIAISSVVMLCLAFLLISKFVNSPLKRLTAGVEQLASGDLDAMINITSKDEMGLLAKAFNGMTVRLKDSIAVIAREQAEKERISAELDVATKIQASMLPCIFPAFPTRPEFDIYATMIPAKEVGGDFYDFFLIDDNKLALVIADVSGKGVPAALFMVITKTLLKNNAQYGKSPKEIFETVNNLLCENNEAQMFVTAFLGIWDMKTGVFSYVNAGHNPPYIKHADGDYERLNTLKPGFVLAGMEGMSYRQGEITLSKGDTIFMYTDGVTEAVNPNNELFTDQRLLEVVNRYKSVELTEFIVRIKAEIDIFENGAEQADDITMLVFKITGGAEWKELMIDANLDNLVTVLDFIGGELEAADCSMKLQTQVALAAEEIFVNIAHYAYPRRADCAPEAGGVVIRVSVSDEVVIKFEDKGIQYNPLDKADPDITLGADEREIGGLGVFMVKKIMDTVEYRHEDGKNILTICKNIGS